ncbi:hypothetical protein VNO77_10160 [Canavalia gladiata]|uniref:Uncharacterized protein n=1 Tax=Canavalia gladiata TaxID=3824 RepID=A0AAN9MA22_CANGL
MGRSSFHQNMNAMNLPALLFHYNSRLITLENLVLRYVKNDTELLHNGAGSYQALDSCSGNVYTECDYLWLRMLNA